MQLGVGYVMYHTILLFHELSGLGMFYAHIFM